MKNPFYGLNWPQNLELRCLYAMYPLADPADVFDIDVVCGSIYLRAEIILTHLTLAEKLWPLLAVRMCLIETIDDVNEIIWFSSGPCWVVKAESSYLKIWPPSNRRVRLHQDNWKILNLASKKIRSVLLGTNVQWRSSISFHNRENKNDENTYFLDWIFLDRSYKWFDSTKIVSVSSIVSRYSHENGI